MSKFPFARLIVVGSMVATFACGRNSANETGSAAASPNDSARTSGTYQNKPASKDSANAARAITRDTLGTSAARDSARFRSGQAKDTTMGGMRHDSTGMSKMRTDSTSVSGQTGTNPTGMPHDSTSMAKPQGQTTQPR